MSIPETGIYAAIPSLDRRIDVGCIGGVVQCMHHLKRWPYHYCGNSDIALARNVIANRFMEKETDFDWFMMIDSDIEFDLSDFELLWEGDEPIVTAEYSKKVIGQPPASFGLGFTRVHRDVFQKMKDAQTSDGQEAVPRFYYDGAVHCAYFTSGPSPEARWIGEDRSLFMRIAMLTNCTYRLEKRTRLRHIGWFAYHYPDQIPDFAAETGQGAN